MVEMQIQYASYSTSQVTRTHKPKGDRTSFQGMLVSLLEVNEFGIAYSLLSLHAVEITVHVCCSPPPHSNSVAFSYIYDQVVCLFVFNMGYKRLFQ